MTHRFSRRAFLRTAGTLVLAPALAGNAKPLKPRFVIDPFTLGVASGSPLPDGVVLWTRLDIRALANAGDSKPIPVLWEVAVDETFRNVVSHGKTNADPAYGYSVHVEVTGLQPDRWYWYRFMSADAVSPVGRTRTASALDALTGLRFAFASCQQYEQGYFVAHRHLAEEDLDLVVFLGDYIYESSWGKNHVRKHGAPEPFTLEQYRERYALYKRDSDLQRSHARFPWLVTWDDHEVSNDYANDRSQNLDPDFLQRRAAAYQAFYEHMPLRASAKPNGSGMRLYGHHDFGRLARFYLLDDRQYRTPQACPQRGRGGSNVVRPEQCRELRDEERTLLGSEQETWLADQLGQSKARWNILAQQTLMAQLDRKKNGKGSQFWTDGWDGYPAARRRLLTELARRQTRNPLVIGGDVHMSLVCDLKTDFDKPDAPVIATEFCGTSITSQGPTPAEVENWLAHNPHVKFASGEKRGYVTVELNEQRAQVRFRTVASEKDPDAGISTQATFIVEDGRPGAKA